MRKPVFAYKSITVEGREAEASLFEQITAAGAAGWVLCAVAVSGDRQTAYLTQPTDGEDDAGQGAGNKAEQEKPARSSIQQEPSKAEGHNDADKGKDDGADKGEGTTTA